MSNIAILENKDGTISVVTPAKNKSIEDVIDKANPNNLPFKVMDDSALPNDRIFRNAWILSKGKVVIDKQKAIDIHLNRLRLLRKKQLAKLDIEVTKAIALQDKKLVAELEAKRQELRDMPENLKLKRYAIKNLYKQKPKYLEGDIESLKNTVPKNT